MAVADMKKNIGWSVLLFLALIPMLYHADYVTEGAKYGLLLWYQSVVPALFPFMVISGLIVNGGAIPVIMAPVHRLLGFVLPVTRDGCYVLVSGLLCGYPMGAKTCADFVREGLISPKEGKFLMAICNHPSPMFLLGYVYPFFSEWLDVRILLISVYGPILLLACCSKWFYFQESAREDVNHAFSGQIPERYRNPKEEPLSGFYKDSLLSPDEKIHISSDETILSAATILCKIGGYLVLFSILIVFLRNMSSIPVSLRLLFIGMLEMTTGIRELCVSLTPAYGFIASVAALTFGGFSGIFQTKAVLGSWNAKKAVLSIRPYIIWKLFHAVLSAGIAFLLCNC